MNTKKPYLSLPCLMLSATLASVATAQTEPSEEQMLVTATRTEQALSSLPMTVQLIERSDILEQLSAGDSLATLLGKLVPGMGVSTQVATDFSQNLRGRKILYLIDGVPQRDNRNVSRFLTTVSPLTVARIEVISNASAVYGAGGAGGILNIITRSGEGELSLEGRVAISNANREWTNKSASLVVDGTGAGWDYLISASAESRGAEYDADGERIAPEPAQTSRFDSESRAALVKLGYTFNADSHLGLSLDYYKDEQDTDYGPNFGGPGIPALLNRTPVEASAVPGLALEAQPESQRQAAQLSYQHTALGSSQLQLQIYHREREYRFFPFPGMASLSLQPAIAAVLGTDNAPVVYVNQSTSKATVDGLRLTVTSDLSTAWQLTWGADASNDRGEQSASSYAVEPYLASGGLIYEPLGLQYSYGPDVETQSRALFGNNKWDIGDAWTLRAGVRYEHINARISAATPPLETLFLHQYGDTVSLLNGYGLIQGDASATPLSEGSIRDADWLFNAGASYRLGQTHTLFGNYSEGFELPDYARLLRDALAHNSVLLELGQGLQATTVDNTELEAIGVKSVEFGWRFNSAVVSAHAALFASRSSKTTAFNRDYTVDMLDQEKTISGLEASLTYNLGNDWKVGGSYAYTQGHTDSEAGDQQALPVVEVPPSKISAFLSWQHAPFQLRLQGLWVGNDDRAQQDAANEPSVDGYQLFDLLCNVALPVGQLDLAVTNLLNENYQTVYSQWAEGVYGSYSGIPAQGRMFNLGYRFKF